MCCSDAATATAAATSTDTVLWQMLAAWHDAGYWLGDVKPSNLVVDTSSAVGPQLYAIDFEAVVSAVAGTGRWRL